MPKKYVVESRKQAVWRNRIVGEGEEPADQLLANPRNWRIHPKNQQDAITGVLDQVGWVQRVIVNQRTGFVVDGHARVGLAISRGEKVPVVYVDLSDDEEALVLASLDPIAAMAGKDEEILRGLIAELPAIESDALREMMEGCGADEGRSLDQNAQVTCPSCGNEFTPTVTLQSSEAVA